MGINRYPGRRRWVDPVTPGQGGAGLGLAQFFPYARPMKPDLLLLSTPLAGRTLPGGVCPSLSNITLGTALRHHGASVEVLDPSVDLGEDLGDAATLIDRIAEAALARAPRIIGASCLSPVEGRFGAALARAVKARSPQTPVVMGGIWASACAADILQRCPEVDAVVAGPGERGALALTRGGLADPGSVPGLVWRDGASARRNPEDACIQAPDTVDLSLMAHPERYDIFCWLTSRGCPFHCAFCSERVTSPQFTLDPLSKVRADVAALAQHPWYLWVCDPLFGAQRPRLWEICDALAPTGLKFLAESRVDVLHPDDVPHLARAGCTLMYFGLEAVTQRSLLEIEKIDGRPSRHRRYLEGARNVIEACLRHDILPVLGVLQPVPGDTPAELEEALAFLTELAGIAARLGPAAHGLGPCFHAFPLRLDRGAPYERQLGRLAQAGVTWSPAQDLLFEDRFLVNASPTMDAATAERFRAAVRVLNPTAPAVQQRLWRSFPRPYVRFEV